MNVSGFIVCSRKFDAPLILVTKSCIVWRNVPSAGILLRENRSAAVFPTRAAAYAAIRRTVTYFERTVGHRDPFEGFVIRKLVPVGGAS